VRRRGFFGLLAALPLLTAAGGLELLKPRRAKFEEVGDSVLMTAELPELLLTRDADAMASIESAFRTRLEYEVSLYRAGQSDPIEQRRVTVYIQWDPWKERFVVETQEQGRSPTRRYFADRDEAIGARSASTASASPAPARSSAGPRRSTSRPSSANVTRSRRACSRPTTTAAARAATCRCSRAGSASSSAPPRAPRRRWRSRPLPPSTWCRDDRTTRPRQARAPRCP
jgi:hypothetical protein